MASSCIQSTEEEYYSLLTLASVVTAGEMGPEGSLVGQRQAALHLARDHLVTQLERELASSKSLNASYEAR